MRRIILSLVVALLVVEHAWLLAPTIKAWIFPPLTHAAADGRAVAIRLGCPACHGADAGGGFRNPGSDGDVPALAGGEMMMWADSEQELREWILHGHPLSQERDYEPSGYDAGQGSGRAVVMPEFENHLRPGELGLLLEWLRAVSGLQFPAEPEIQRGLDLAHELGCFDCHGPMGTGGVSNPGSLKGYVPGLFGADYDELVRSPAELLQWIRSGISDRFSDNPVARTVIARQALKMPAYGNHLDATQLEDLAALVEWLASRDWERMPIP
jgi:cytochrome c553